MFGSKNENDFITFDESHVVKPEQFNNIELFTGVSH